MSLETSSAAFGLNGLAGPSSAYRSYQQALSEQKQSEGNSMELSRTNKARTYRAETGPNFSDTDDADVIFIKDWASRLSAKEGARLARMTPSGFKKVQLGENTISYKKLTRWLKADTDFAAAYAAHIGLILPGEAESASAFTRAVNAYQRRGV